MYCNIVLVKARFIVEPVTEYMRTRNNDYGLYLNGDAYKFDLGYVYTPLASQMKTDDENHEIEAQHLALLGILISYCYM